MHSAAPKLYKESCETGKEEVSLSVQSITFCRLQSLKVSIHKKFYDLLLNKNLGDDDFFISQIVPEMPDD